MLDRRWPCEYQARQPTSRVANSPVKLVDGQHKHITSSNYSVILSLDVGGPYKGDDLYPPILDPQDPRSVFYPIEHFWTILGGLISPNCRREEFINLSLTVLGAIQFGDPVGNGPRHNPFVVPLPASFLEAPPGFEERPMVSWRMMNANVVDREKDHGNSAHLIEMLLALEAANPFGKPIDWIAKVWEAYERLAPYILREWCQYMDQKTIKDHLAYAFLHIRCLRRHAEWQAYEIDETTSPHFRPNPEPLDEWERTNVDRALAGMGRYCLVGAETELEQIALGQPIWSRNPTGEPDSNQVTVLKNNSVKKAEYLRKASPVCTVWQYDADFAEVRRELIILPHVHPLMGEPRKIYHDIAKQYLWDDRMDHPSSSYAIHAWAHQLEPWTTELLGKSHYQTQPYLDELTPDWVKNPEFRYATAGFLARRITSTGRAQFRNFRGAVGTPVVEEGGDVGELEPEAAEPEFQL